MLRLLFSFYCDVIKYNLLISFLSGLIGLMSGEGFTSVFLISFNTAGYVFGLYFYGLFHNNDYYFYYNKHLSKLKLYSYSSILNSILSGTALLIIRLANMAG